MKRLLLVDDDASNRVTLAALLEDEGFSVDALASYAEGKAQLASAAPYEVALFDQNLGDGTGTELLRELRARMPAAKAILVSGSLTDEARAATGFDAHLEKGVVSFPDILETLRATLERR